MLILFTSIININYVINICIYMNKVFNCIFNHIMQCNNGI